MNPRRRSRPSKIITRVIAFLLAGVIVNVAVAWGCKLWSPIKTFRSLNDPEVASVQSALNLHGDDRADFFTCIEAFGRRDVFVDSMGIDDQPAVRGGSV